MNRLDRRSFLKTGAALAPLSVLPESKAASAARPPRPIVICSQRNDRLLETVMAGLAAGTDPVEAVVDGIALVEDDPRNGSSGVGGLPNEHGVVQLDASVMHGPTHKAGAVAAIENIRNPSRVALEVLRRTDHVLLAGDGALQFARAMGFEEENLLTERTRQAWLRWKASRSPTDDWLDPDQEIPIPHSTGTIHCAAMDAAGNLGACTSTAGKSYKIPGRVGDTPIIGAGLFVDNAVGSAGAIGLGEHVIQAAGAFQAVRNMAEGDDPAQACKRVLRWIADHTTIPRLLNDAGQPAFGVVLYALRRDGACGGASIRGTPSLHVHDGTIRSVPCVPLFE
ncbi:MAG: N(4)-(beta-N-acetylglucosaminyl)-L-asparaginase [Planctomycetota bacterium]|jgi:N4-(beta-N-acetylglucosaminyl)-L-asparaginase